jgi:hypothetical protein
MCLSRSTRDPIKKELEKVIYAWRVFKVDGSNIHSIYHDNGPMTYNRWYKSGEPGYHAFLTRAAAREWICKGGSRNEQLFKVAMRKPIHFGVEYGFKALTAGEMLILERVR